MKNILTNALLPIAYAAFITAAIHFHAYECNKSLTACEWVDPWLGLAIYFVIPIIFVWQTIHRQTSIKLKIIFGLWATLVCALAVFVSVVNTFVIYK